MNTKPYRQAVLSIFINDKQQVLIGSSPRDGGYKFPQGGLDPNENPQEGLIREIQEELGYTLNSKNDFTQLTPTVKYQYPPHYNKYKQYQGQEIHVFKIQYTPDMKLIPQDHEFQELIWINPQNLTLATAPQPTKQP